MKTIRSLLFTNALISVRFTFFVYIKIHVLRNWEARNIEQAIYLLKWEFPSYISCNPLLYRRTFCEAWFYGFKNNKTWDSWVTAHFARSSPDRRIVMIVDENEFEKFETIPNFQKKDSASRFLLVEIYYQNVSRPHIYKLIRFQDFHHSSVDTLQSIDKFPSPFSNYTLIGS